MLLKLYKKENQIFPVRVQILKALAKNHRSYFLSFDWVKQKKEHPYRFLLLIRAYYRLFIFFPDQEVLARFRKFGLTEFELQRFTPIEALTSEFDALEDEKGMLVWRYLAITYINAYLEIKLDHTLATWANSNFPHQGFRKLKNLSKNFLRTANRNLKSPGKYQRSYTTRVREVYDLTTKNMVDKAEFNEYFSKATKGNVDAMYIQLLISFCITPKPFIKTVKGKPTISYISENEYLWRVSKILLLITKRYATIATKEKDIYVKKESDGVRMDTIRSLKKIVRDGNRFVIPKLLSEHLASL